MTLVVRMSIHATVTNDRLCRREENDNDSEEREKQEEAAAACLRSPQSDFLWSSRTRQTTRSSWNSWWEPFVLVRRQTDRCWQWLPSKWIIDTRRKREGERENLTEEKETMKYSIRQRRETSRSWSMLPEEMFDWANEKSVSFHLEEKRDLSSLSIRLTNREKKTSCSQLHEVVRSEADILVQQKRSCLRQSHGRLNRNAIYSCKTRQPVQVARWLIGYFSSISVEKTSLIRLEDSDCNRREEKATKWRKWVPRISTEKRKARSSMTIELLHRRAPWVPWLIEQVHSELLRWIIRPERGLLTQRKKIPTERWVGDNERAWGV